MLKLMQPKLHVPSDHPLLTYEYPENDAWNAKEIEIFQQAILKFDKNFSRIAQHVSYDSRMMFSFFLFIRTYIGGGLFCTKDRIE